MVASSLNWNNVCIRGKLFNLLLHLRSPRDCGSCRPLYSNHATDRPATCAHSSEVASMVADFYGAIQVLRNGGGGVWFSGKKALRRCNVHITPHEGVGGGPISRKKALRNTWMAPMWRSLPIYYRYGNNVCISGKLAPLRVLWTSCHVSVIPAFFTNNNCW